MGYNICSMLKWTDEISSHTESYQDVTNSFSSLVLSQLTIVHDEWYASFMSNCRYLRNARDVILRVADTLYVDCFCLLIDGLREHLRIIRLYELDSYIKLLEKHLELVIGLGSSERSASARSNVI